MSRSSWPLLALALTALFGVAACRSGGSDDGEPHAGPTTTTRRDRPSGPAADLSEELTGGHGAFLAAAAPGVDLKAHGWVEHEYVAAGHATSYVSEGDYPSDGRFAFHPGETAEYRTRVVVRRPARAADFRGTVVVEWLNVSGGLDAGPEFTLVGEELVRRGMAWVGVSAQRIGVEGGDVAVSSGAASAGVAGKGLKAIDPARYGSLAHPGDAFAYDIFTQVARAVRAGHGLGDLRPARVLAIGESQSAFALTTYVNGVQPLTRAFDGFLIHSRGAAALPVGKPGESVSIANAIGATPVHIRPDADVPVLVLETETDVLPPFGYAAARQPDSESFRLWEMAGTAHADTTLVGPLAQTLDCGVPINDGPQRFIDRAAVRALDTWVRTGTAPRSAPRLELRETATGTVLVRDPDGIARGGIRLPQVEAPVAALTGEPGPRGGVICLLLGSTKPFSAEQLARYTSRTAYLDAYRRATDRSIDDGYALREDRAEILADADPSKLPG